MGEIRTVFSAQPTDGKISVAVCMSGTGSNADVLLKCAESDKVHFKVAVIFTDAPETSNAFKLGEKYRVPVESLDICKFYAEHGESDIRLNSERRRELRDMWSEKVWEILQPYQCSFAVFAGFVPLTNLSEKLPCLNVHPGDLTVEKNGERLYAGLHYAPVERAICNGEKNLRSSVILVQSYTDKKDIDAGFILAVSAPVPVDLGGFTLAELQQIKAEREKGKSDDALRKTAKDNIERLKVGGDHLVLPAAVELFAAGRYGTDDEGHLFFKAADGNWNQIVTVEISADKEPQMRMVEKRVAKSRSRLVRFCKFLYMKMVRGDGSPSYIARGWALGMFIGCVVPVFCQLVVAIPLSFVFRCSKVGAALGTFITTPPTAIFIYPVVIWVGNKVIGGGLSAESGSQLLAVFNNNDLSFAAQWSAFADLGGELVAAFFVGGLLWAAIMTPLTYFGVRFLVIRYRELKKKRLNKKAMSSML